MQNAPVEHSAILFTCNKLPLVFKTLVLSIKKVQCSIISQRLEFAEYTQKHNILSLLRFALIDHHTS